jgi:hypothetical protein
MNLVGTQVLQEADPDGVEPIEEIKGTKIHRHFPHWQAWHSPQSVRPSSVRWATLSPTKYRIKDFSRHGSAVENVLVIASSLVP